MLRHLRIQRQLRDNGGFLPQNKTQSKIQAHTQANEPLTLPYTHRGVHNACAMGSNGVGDVTDVDGVQVLIVTCLLDENL